MVGKTHKEESYVPNTNFVSTLPTEEIPVEKAINCAYFLPKFAKELFLSGFKKEEHATPSLP